VAGNPIAATVKSAGRRARAKRAKVFRRFFELTPTTKLLDLGCGDGEHIESIVDGSDIPPANVYAADIDEALVNEAAGRYGFTPVVIAESGKLPFPDWFFDIVYCSSAIEHITIPKEEMWTLRSGAEFRRRSLARQREFANEVRRLGKGYFLQTPAKAFPIETHTWLPFVGWLPRPALIRVIRFTNRFWVKQTQPDWHLLTSRDLQSLFPEAEIVGERVLGFTKSIMAVRSPSLTPHVGQD